MTTETLDIEVTTQAENRLVEFAGKTGLDTNTTSPLVAAFRPIFADARKVLSDAFGVAESVKDATCVTEIQKARQCRLAIRKVRIAGENIRKTQKANVLAYGKAVDGFYNILEADLSPVEKALQEAEDTAERAEQKRKDDLEAARKAQLSPYVQDVALYAVRDMTEPAFSALLSGVKTAKEQAEAAAKKAEEDRIAREKAEAEERARVKAENERLKQEAIAKEEALRKEREAAEKKLQAERAEAARKEQELRDKAEAEARAAKAKADKERAELEAKAKAEREAAEAIARKEREEKEKAEAELRRQREAELKRIEAEKEAVRKAEAADDGEKLQAYAVMIRSNLPTLKNAERAELVKSQAAKFWAWLEKQAQQ